MSQYALAQYADKLSDLLYGTAFLALILVVVIAIAAYKLTQRASLTKYRYTKDGFADLLNSAAEVDDGIIVCKNGAMMAAWSYTGVDSDSAEASERNLITTRLNKIFAGLDSGWMIHIDACRHEVPSYFPRERSAFPDPVSAAIDEERRRLFEAQGNIYDSVFVITVTWLPPKLTQQKIVDLMYTKTGEPKDKRRRTEDLIAVFKEKIHSFEMDLKLVFKDVYRLKSEKTANEDGTETVYNYFLSWLQNCITGVYQPIRQPEDPIYLDSLLGAQDFIGGSETPRIGDRHIHVISIEGLGGSTSPGMLTALGELGCNYRWSTRFICLEKHEATAYLNKLRRYWKQKERGFLAQLFNLPGRVNQDAMVMVDEADSALSEVSQGIVSYGFLTQVIVLTDTSLERLNVNTEKIVSVIRNLGLTARVENNNAMEAYLGSLPGHGYENIRRPLIQTMNVANLIPVSTPWIGSAVNPCPFYPENSPALMQCITGRALRTPFRLSLHVGDLGHSLVFGPPGSGKSTFLAMTAAQTLRYPGMTLFSFDKGRSMYALCQAVGGRHYAPGEDDALAFCPLGEMRTVEDLGWSSSWIQTIMELNNVVVSATMVNDINAALQSMLNSKLERSDFGMTLSNFITQVQNQEVREVLMQYSIDGPMGTLLDSDTDGLSFSNFTVVEIESLMNLGDKYALPVLLYLFRRIEKSLRGQPAYILLDEAWLMLGHPTFREKIREWLKVLRKANCAVVLATQSLSDAVRSGILDVLVEATATKIFLPNPNAVQDEPKKLYAQFGLNGKQIQLIAAAIPKRDYFIVNKYGARLFQLALGPLALAFTAVSEKEDVKLVKDLSDKFKERWVDEWLRLRGLSLQEYESKE